MSELKIPLPDYNPEVFVSLPWYAQLIITVMCVVAVFAMIWLMQLWPREESG